MNKEELENKMMLYGSHEYSLFIKDYEKEIKKLSHEDRFFLLKELYISSKEGNWFGAELLQLEVSCYGGVPEKEIDNIKKNINFDSAGYLTVYRGLNQNNDIYGSSYTLDKDRALWFSTRFKEKPEKPKIIEMIVTLNDIIFYSNSRKEQEIFLLDQTIGRSKNND